MLPSFISFKKLLSREIALYYSINRRKGINLFQEPASIDTFEFHEFYYPGFTFYHVPLHFLIEIGKDLHYTKHIQYPIGGRLYEKFYENIVRNMVLDRSDVS